MELMFYFGLFALGAVDALQPGHAKTLISGYLVGANARIQQLMILGFTVLLTHVVVNGALAYGIVSFASAIFDDNYIRYINLMAGVAILLLAFYLVWQRFFVDTETVGTGKSCCDHHQSTPGSSEPMPFWQIVFLGITSGLTPCPVVLTALISAISIGKGPEALFGVAVFSLGMGFVIFLVGLCTLLGVEKLRWFHQSKNVLKLARISALAVLFLGGMLVTKSLFFYEIEEEPPVSLIMISEPENL